MANRAGMMRGALVVVTSVLLAAVAVGCGSSSSSSSAGDAQVLLSKTFSGSHAVKSGVLSFSLALRSGSTPISLSFERTVSEPRRGQAARVRPHHRDRRAWPRWAAGDHLDRQRRLCHAQRDRVPVPRKRFSEARFGLLERRVGCRRPLEAGDRSPALGHKPDRRRHRDGRRSLDDPYPGRREPRRAARRPEYVPAEGVDEHIEHRDRGDTVCRHPPEDRGPGQESVRRRVDRNLRQHAAQAVARLHVPGQRADLDPAWRRQLGRLRDDGSVLRSKPAADDLGAYERAAVQRFRVEVSGDHAAARDRERRARLKRERLELRGRGLRLNLRLRFGVAILKYKQCIRRAGIDVGKMQKCAALINSGGG